MAKATKQKTPADPRAEALAARAASMPEAAAELLEEALLAVGYYHQGMSDGKVDLLHDAQLSYAAAIWKLNGGTSFGCMANQDSPGRVVERYCAVRPGGWGCWGARAEFAIKANGMRARVAYHGMGWASLHSIQFDFHVLDLDRPFISPTGYKSHQVTIDRCFHKTLEKAAIDALAALQSDAKPGMVEDGYRNRLAAVALPEWCQALSPAPAWEPATIEMPPGYVLVEAVIPAYQAYVARQWAEAARVQIEAAKKIEQQDAKGKTGRDRPRADTARTDDAGLARPVPAETTIPGGSFTVGMRCVIIGVNHPAMKAVLGRKVVIAKVNEASRVAWVYDDKPVTYRTNQAGRRVVDHDPRCIQSLYVFEQLAPAT